jgi:hypothetical protein
MKSGKPKNAPKVKIYDPKKNFMREADQMGRRTPSPKKK